MSSISQSLTELEDRLRSLAESMERLRSAAELHEEVAKHLGDLGEGVGRIQVDVEALDQIPGVKTSLDELRQSIEKLRAEIAEDHEAMSRMPGHLEEVTAALAANREALEPLDSIPRLEATVSASSERVEALAKQVAASSDLAKSLRGWLRTTLIVMAVLILALIAVGSAVTK